MEEIRDYRPPEPGVSEAVKAATKLPPLTNFPGEGTREITKAVWDAKHKDYKATHIAKASEKHGAYRYRVMMISGYSLVPVYLADQKRIDPPPPAGPAPELPPPAPARREFSQDVQFTRATTEEIADAVDPANAFKAMEETLRAGVKVVSAPQLFPTPSELAERMAQMADIRPGDEILEPSAGTGRILDACFHLNGFGWNRPLQTGRLVAVELNCSLAAALRDRYPLADVRQANFLECNGDLGTFDVVLMNPPFADGADIRHIHHAVSMLKPGGRLVAICANGPRQNEKLRPLVEELGGDWEDLPRDTFKESGTGVNTALISLRK